MHVAHVVGDHDVRAQLGRAEDAGSLAGLAHPDLFSKSLAALIARKHTPAGARFGREVADERLVQQAGRSGCRRALRRSLRTYPFGNVGRIPLTALA
ncbi:MAG: hypothetical protein ACRDZ4_09890 [Egibacteraceae bacterium]